MGLDPWHLTTSLALETADKTTPEDKKNSLSSKFDTFCQEISSINLTQIPHAVVGAFFLSSSQHS